MEPKIPSNTSKDDLLILIIPRKLGKASAMRKELIAQGWKEVKGGYWTRRPQ